MSIINHYTSSCRQPCFPSKRAEAQDSNQHHPTALPFPGTHFQFQKPLQPPTTGMPDIAASLKDAGFMTKKTFSGGRKNDYTHPLELQSLFMGPLVQLPEEKRTSPTMKESAMADQVQKFVLAVSVSSAVELDERQLDLIARKVKRMTGFSNLRMENTVDQTLIAGFVISYGDDESHVIDLSVKGQLANLASRVESSDRWIVPSSVKTGPSITDAAMARLAQGTKVFAEGGNERVFQQNFGIYTGEKLRKTFACYLSTSTGPVIGTLYLSSLRLAFYSNKALCHYTPSGQQEWLHYKVVVLLNRLKAVNPSSGNNNSEKYVQIVASDGHKFWFMGFVSYENAVKNLKHAAQLPDMKQNH